MRTLSSRVLAVSFASALLLGIAASPAYAVTFLDSNYQPITTSPASAPAAGTKAQATPAATPAASTQASPTAAPAKSTTATADSSGSGKQIINPIKFDSLQELLGVILGALVELGTIVLILAFVWVGFSFVRAQGNPEGLEKAKMALIWTIIGGAILLGAKAIASVIESTVQSL